MYVCMCVYLYIYIYIYSFINITPLTVRHNAVIYNTVSDILYQWLSMFQPQALIIMQLINNKKESI